MATRQSLARRNTPTYLFRIPPGLRERLDTLAAEQGLSLNTMMLLLLAGAVGFSFEKEESEDSGWPENEPEPRRTVVLDDVTIDPVARFP